MQWYFYSNVNGPKFVPIKSKLPDLTGIYLICLQSDWLPRRLKPADFYYCETFPCLRGKVSPRALPGSLCNFVRLTLRLCRFDCANCDCDVLIVPGADFSTIVLICPSLTDLSPVCLPLRFESLCRLLCPRMLRRCVVVPWTIFHLTGVCPLHHQASETLPCLNTTVECALTLWKKGSTRLVDPTVRIGSHVTILKTNDDWIVYLFVLDVHVNAI